MGRHAVPDDGEETAPTATAKESAAGRHHALSEGPDHDSETLVFGVPAGLLSDHDPATTGEPEVAGSRDLAAAARAPQDSAKPGGESPTQADLRLLRTQPGLRSRCAAGVVVPYLLFTIVIIVIGRTDVYLIWVWIPTVLAGVLVGSFLDRAHKNPPRPPEPDGSGPSAAQGD
jgi:hypothetical protein